MAKKYNPLAKFGFDIIGDETDKSGFLSSYVNLTKTYANQPGKWFKVASLKSSNSYLGKTLFAFDIFSVEKSYLGSYFGSFILDLRASGTNSMFGGLFCTTYYNEIGSQGSDKLFTLEDIKVTYNKTDVGYEATVWKKSRHADDSYFLGVCLVDNLNSVEYFNNISVSTLPNETWTISAKEVSDSKKVARYLDFRKSGNFDEKTYRFDIPILFKAVILSDNCDNISIIIGENEYDKDSIVNVNISALVQFSVVDLTIKPGYDYADALIKFEEV